MSLPWVTAHALKRAAQRWRSSNYTDPRLLRAVRRWAQTDDDPQAYGHLRPAAR